MCRTTRCVPAAPAHLARVFLESISDNPPAHCSSFKFAWRMQHSGDQVCVAPYARLDDGLLDLMIIPSMGKVWRIHSAWAFHLWLLVFRCPVY
jgi:hypothetical protein